MSGCPTCGGYGMRHDPIAHDAEPPEATEDPMTAPECTCTELQRITVCHDMRNEPHLVGCPRWGFLK